MGGVYVLRAVGWDRAVGINRSMTVHLRTHSGIQKRFGWWGGMGGGGGGGGV